MTLIMSTDDPIPEGLKMLVANNLLLDNDPTLRNDGEPNDGSVVVIDSYQSGIKFIGNTVITPTPAPLIYCIRERENAYPVFAGNVLSNNAGEVFSEDCHRP